MAHIPPGAGDTGEGLPVWGEGLGHHLCAAWEPPQPHSLSGLGADSHCMAMGLGEKWQQ